MMPRTRTERPERRLPHVLAVVLAVAALGACELMVHEGAPGNAADCQGWRGGCPATIDYAAETTAPISQSENRFAGNVAYAAGADRRRCRDFPTGCQLMDVVDTIDERYASAPR